MPVKKCAPVQSACTAAAGGQAIAAHSVKKSKCVEMRGQYQNLASPSLAEKYMKLGCNFKIGPIFSTLIT